MTGRLETLFSNRTKLSSSDSLNFILFFIFTKIRFWNRYLTKIIKSQNYKKNEFLKRDNNQKKQMLTNRSIKVFFLFFSSINLLFYEQHTQQDNKKRADLPRAKAAYSSEPSN